MAVVEVSINIRGLRLCSTDPGSSRSAIAGRLGPSCSGLHDWLAPLQLLNEVQHDLALLHEVYLCHPEPHTELRQSAPAAGGLAMLTACIASH